LLRGRNLWLVGGGLIVLLALWFMFKGNGNANPYRTAPVDRGAIARSVSATGTLQPVVSANVGSTVSGPVQTVEVDFNTPVRVGQVLARLDPTSFQQRVTQLQASLSQAQAQYAVAAADYQRYATLNRAGFASAQLMSQQRAARDTAAAAVAGARASLASAQTDLSRTVIRSPINGVVVDKQVSVGQSVAASFQAATLFTIAQDLSHLQANISVDEADIGDVRQASLQIGLRSGPQRAGLLGRRDRGSRRLGRGQELIKREGDGLAIGRVRPDGEDPPHTRRQVDAVGRREQDHTLAPSPGEAEFEQNPFGAPRAGQHANDEVDTGDQVENLSAELRARLQALRHDDTDAALAQGVGQNLQIRARRRGDEAGLDLRSHDRLAAR